MHLDDFSAKLYAIQPFRQATSPPAKDSPRHSSPPPPLLSRFTVPAAPEFLPEAGLLRRIHSEQVTLQEVGIDESNRKTMTAISSTIDILFSKIEKIKEQFSFALQKTHPQPQIPLLAKSPSFLDTPNSTLAPTRTPQSQEQKSQSDHPQGKEEKPAPQPIDSLDARPGLEIEKVVLELDKQNAYYGHLQSKGEGERLAPSSPLQPRQENRVCWRGGRQGARGGLRIRDFELGRCVGSGKFGDVYLSQHKETGFLCAIKKILKSTLREYEMEGQLARELRIHYSLDHPNVVRLYGHFDDQYHIFLLLELAPDGCLMSRLGMKELEAAELVGQVTEALVHTHRRGVLHRDIKPQNIVLAMGVAKLCDFGWSAQSQKEMHQTFCGTLDYVSPEMKDLGQYDQSIDLWSLGVLTFELLAGFPPFKQQISAWKSQGSKRQVRWNWQVIYPPSIEGTAREFIQSLLRVDPSARASLVECKSHAFLLGSKAEPQEPGEELRALFQ